MEKVENANIVFFDKSLLNGGRVVDEILEREGYVPNVVYTCGALLYGSELIIPYAMADHATGFATVPIDDVLAAMHCEKG